MSPIPRSDAFNYMKHTTPDSDPIARSLGFTPVRLKGKMPSRFCHYCHGGGAETRDHVVPKSRGGSNAWWNLVPAHDTCNAQKGSSASSCTCAFCERARMLYSMDHFRNEVVFA